MPGDNWAESSDGVVFVNDEKTMNKCFINGLLTRVTKSSVGVVFKMNC